MCRQKVEKALKTGRLTRRAKVVAKLCYFIKKNNPKSILLYMPMGHEPDIRRLFQTLRKRVKVYVPFMEGESFRLVQYRLPLQKKKYGILEPNVSHFYLPKIEMAVVPVLGVDGRFRRVGFGKGMYDRFFATLPKRPVTVFVEAVRCLSREKLTDDYDIEADIYITPEEIRVRGKRYVVRTRYGRCGGRR